MLYYEMMKKDESCSWLLFIHGLGGSIKTWKYQIDKFKGTYNLLLVDLDGHGKSEFLNKLSHSELNATANGIHEILYKEMIDKIDIVALSLGTLVGLEFLRLYPNKVDNIILAGCVINLDKKRELLLKVAQKLIKLIPMDIGYRFFANIVMPKKNHKTSRLFFVKESKAMSKKAFLLWLNSIQLVQDRLNEYIKTINDKGIGVLFISGEEDYMFVNCIKRLNEKINDFKLVLVENCGHVCSIEKSHLFNILVYNWLQVEHILY